MRCTQMIRHATAFALTLLGVTGFANGQPPEMDEGKSTAKKALALRVVLEDTWQPVKPSIAMIAGEAPTAVNVKLPARTVPKGKLLVMRFRTRMVWESFAGWNNFLRIDVNGSAITAHTKDGLPRILNRAGPSMKTSSPKWPSEAYFKAVVTGTPALLTVFSPHWQTLEPRFITDRDELYWFLLDVTDLIKDGTTNTITFTNLALAKYFKRDVEEMKKHPLLIDDLEFGLVDEMVRDRLVEDLAGGMARFKAAVSVARSGVELAASAGGALRVSYRGDTYFCRSSFSEPGTAIRYNQFWWEPTKGWQVSVAKSGPATIVITGQTMPYRVERRATLDGQFVKLRDTITNVGDRDVGIMLKHEIVAGVPASKWRLSGLPGRPAYSDTAANPTVHFSRPTTGCGAAVLDSVMRAQMVESGGRRKLSFDNDHFGLAPGKAHTFKWSVYVGGPDFWEFINAVRRDWGVNATIPGMFSFWRPETGEHQALLQKPEKLRAYLGNKRIDVFSLSPWFEYYSPVKYWQPRSVYREIVQDTMTKIRAAQPDAKCIANVESFLYYAPESFFNGTLPKHWTDAKGVLPRGPLRPHSYSLSPAATKVVDATPWRDSVFRDVNGNVEIDLHYSGAYRDGGVNLKVFPTLDNYWHGKFISMIDFLINDCGLDGIYIDSFSYYHNRSYGRWDGYSVDMDPTTGVITRKYARLGLLTAAARREWVKYVTDQGKICYVNGKRSTEELQNLEHIGFMEAEWTFDPSAEQLAAPRAAKAQLGSPLALGVRPHRWPEHKTQYAQIVQKAVIAYLRHGALYCHYTTEIPEPGRPGGGGCGVLNHMFPFTPVALHEGWVLGKERIITAVSGTYRWSRAERPTCLRFDLRGLPLKGGFDLARSQEGWQVRVSLKDWQETAVIKAAGER